MDCCPDVIQPSLKLKRMFTLLRWITILHFLIMLIDIFFTKTLLFIILIFQVLLIILINCSKHFGHYLYFILYITFNILILINSLVAWFIKGIYTNNDSVKLCSSVFLLVFEIFCTYVVFQVYKQAKHEYRIQYGFFVEDNEIDN